MRKPLGGPFISLSLLPQAWHIPRLQCLLLPEASSSAELRQVHERIMRRWEEKSFVKAAILSLRWQIFFSYELFLQEIYQQCDFRAFKSLRKDSGAQFGSTNIKTGTAPVQGWQKICQVSHMFDMDGPGALDSIQSEVSQRKINIVY